MNTKQSKHAFAAMISAFLMIVVIAALYSPKTSISNEADHFGDARKSTSVSSFLNQIIGESNEPVAEPETFKEDNIWYAGMWDATLYLNTRFPKTVAIRLKLLEKETQLPITGAGVSIQGEYMHTFTGPGSQSEIDLSIFRDLKELPPQRRKFRLDAISESRGFVVFALKWQKQYSWQSKTEEKDSPVGGGGTVIQPDAINCVVKMQISHPEYKNVEIPVDFKRFADLKPVVLDLDEKFPDFNKKNSRRIEFFEKILTGEDTVAYGNVKPSAKRDNKTKCGPYLVYDLGDVLLQRTATPRIPVKEPVEIPQPQPPQQTKPPERTVEPREPIVRERIPAPKSIEPPKPVAQPTRDDSSKPVIDQTNSNIKVVNLGDDVSMIFALLPAGEFYMGSPADEMGRDADEGPVYKVRIDKPFYMGVHEVTQEQYKTVMGTNPSNKYIGPKYPVNMISWNEAKGFCQRLSSSVGEPFRLPTEAEWEYACRAGSTTAYYWGNSFDDRYAWTLDNSKGILHEVGTRLPNAWGLYDMSGNLWEWCENAYAEQYEEPDGYANLKDASDSVDRILRGGSWNVRSLFSRSANRSRNAPNTRMNYNGFRVVMDIK